MQAAEARLHTAGFQLCPHCDAEIQRDFLRCPSCLRKLKEPCRNCSKPLEPRWRICPFCETEVAQAEGQPKRRPPQRRSTPRTTAAAAETAAATERQSTP